MADQRTLRPARTLVLLRILTLYPVALGWVQDRPAPVEVGLVSVLVVGTSMLALRWHAVAPFVRRHAAVAALDVAISLVVLTYAGPTSPFVAYTLTSAVLVGLLFPRLGAVLLCTLLISGYLLLRTLDQDQPAGAGLVAVPAAYALLTGAGAAFRGVHDQLTGALCAAVTAERAAATANERTRLARDLHDGVSSTLQGLVLQAMAVARSASGADPRVAELARQLESAARAAHAQSREVLTGLRREDDSAPLVQAVADRVRRWSQSTGIAADFSTAGVADVDASSRVAALRVLDEALENVHRHAQADRVQVSLCGDDRCVRLCVQDDGRGLGPDRPGVGQGHYGLLGMSERAAVVGARLSIEPGDLGKHPPGTRVSLEFARAPASRQSMGAPA